MIKSLSSSFISTCVHDCSVNLMHDRRLGLILNPLARLLLEKNTKQDASRVGLGNFLLLRMLLEIVVGTVVVVQ